jgi:hypothetical protein
VDRSSDNGGSKGRKGREGKEKGMGKLKKIPAAELELEICSSTWTGAVTTVRAGLSQLVA